MEGLRRALDSTVDGRPTGIAHGTTVATNAMLEQRFHSLALCHPAASYPLEVGS